MARTIPLLLLVLLSHSHPIQSVTESGWRPHGPKPSRWFELNGKRVPAGQEESRSARERAEARDVHSRLASAALTERPEPWKPRVAFAATTPLRPSPDDVERPAPVSELSVRLATVQGVGLLALAFAVGATALKLGLPYLRDWTLAWISLAAALLALQLSFRWASGLWIRPLYHFGEYAFLYLLFVGSRRYVDGTPPPPRELRFGTVPAMAMAVALPLALNDFTDAFAIQAATMALGFAVSLATLLRARDRGWGVRLTLAGLVLLTVDFLHYVPIFAASPLSGVNFNLPPLYHGFTSLIDLALEGFLTLGILMLSIEDSARRRDGGGARPTPQTPG
jgi:hypothetical protein